MEDIGKQENKPTLEQLEAELDRVKYKSRYGETLRSTIYILILKPIDYTKPVPTDFQQKNTYVY